MRAYGLWILVLIVQGDLFAQDPHYSQYYQDPLYLNPALAGTFDGTYRFTGHYRNQWSAISRPFETFGVGVDAANVLGISKVGAGLNIFNDVAGDGNLSNLQINLALSYAFQLTADSAHQLVVGGQGGWYRRQLNVNELTFDDQYQNGQFQPGIATRESFAETNTNNFNTNVGVAWRGVWRKRLQALAGISLANLTRPDLSFTGTEEPLDQRITVHGQVQFPVHARFDLIPGVLYHAQGPHREALGGANLKYLLDTRAFSYRAIYFGGWYRNEDAAILFAGLDWNDLNVGLSYDINTSGLDRASNNRGGWEISVVYIIRHVLPKRMRFKTCPDYI